MIFYDTEDKWCFILYQLIFFFHKLITIIVAFNEFNVRNVFLYLWIYREKIGVYIEKYI